MVDTKSKVEKKTHTVKVFNLDEINYLETSWQPSFFNTIQFIKAQATDNGLVFILTSLSTKQTRAYFILFVENNAAVSPKRAPFGSFEMASDLSSNDLRALVESILDYCKSHHLMGLTIKNFPTCYNPIRATQIKNVLLSCGFGIKQDIDNQYLDVLHQAFEQQIHISERRRLKKCLYAGFELSEWIQPSPEEVYEFIRNNRKQLGYPMGFELDELKTWFINSPNQYKVFCVRTNDEIIALSLAVLVKENILYNFCPADALSYRSYSPSVLLTKGLYEYCQQQGITILDLGVSLDASGEPKPSLVRFKRNLGAETCKKQTFVKTWELS